MTIEALSEMLAWINHVPGWVPRLAAFVAWGRFVKLPIEPRGAARTASA